MGAVVEVLYQSNFRDVPSTLRKIADEIEAGDYGEIGCAGIVLLGDKLEIFCAGPDSDGTSVACVLQAGANKMVRAIEDHSA